jgi:PAS domain S-box-containing protein
MKYYLPKLFTNKSISKVFLFSLLGMTFFVIIVIGSFGVHQEKQKFKIESEKIHDNFYKDQKNKLLRETQSLINFIDNERQQTRNLLKNDIRSRVYEAHSVASNIYENYKHKLSHSDIKNIIINALRPLRFNKGKGSFYINNLNGIVIMDPENTNFECKNKLALKDVYGAPIIQNEIETAKAKNEGYTDYSWQNDNEQKIHPKISFVKLFKPFNWYIGCTQYVENYKNDVKLNTLKSISDLKFNPNYSIAVFGFDGTCFSHENSEIVGKNLWTKENPDGKKVVQELITRGTDENGGFIIYNNPFDKNNSTTTLTYAKAFKDWQWVICSSVNTTELHNAIAKRKQELESSVNRYVLRLSIVLLLTGVFIVFFTRYIVKLSKSGIEVFTNFFEQATSDSTLIDTSSLSFREFKKLGELANQMVQKRKEAENQLHIETAYFEQLFENSPEAIAITDPESKGIKINKQFTNLFGYTKEDIEGVVIDTLLTDKTKENEAINLNSITARGQLIEVETRRKCKNGKLVDVSIMGNPIIANNKVQAIFGIYRDITQRKEYEKHLKEAKNRAEESDRLKSAFLANMSHEIRTPMNHILGFTDLMTTQFIEEKERQEYASLIKQSGSNLLQLINNIIDLSKIESRQIKLHKTPTSINQVLAVLYEKYYSHKNTFNRNNLILKVQKALSDQDSVIITDAKRLEQLLSNLIDNAIKFTEEGSVEFGYQLRDNNTLEFFVSDTGIGIPEDNLKDIFKTFRQVDGSDTRQYGGTGLGLTITHRLVEILGGTISIESTIRKGTSFYISLPYTKPEKSESELYNWKDKKILIVDDEKNNFEFFKSSIAKTNATIFWAKNGLEAIDLCQSVEFDLILMDVQMPSMNGFDATKQIKSHNANITIIGQTAYNEQDYKQRMMNAGCDDYLTKPIHSGELLDSINRQFSIN